jgi:type III pantothenate kinase
MLLVIDVGNTNIVIGIFDGETLKENWRLGTDVGKTADEFGILFKELLVFSQVKREQISGIVLSSVVPPLLFPLMGLARKYFGIEPLIVEPGIKTGMTIHLDNPREVGADRIVNAVAGFDKYRTALIVIDFGTATTFDFVTSQGTFEGGVISPGLMISAEALFRQASKLPRVELVCPKSVLGKNTITAMQAGIVLGYAGLVDALIRSLKAEIKASYPREPVPKVIATGGLVQLIADQCPAIEVVDANLTLDGLRIIYRRNSDSHKSSMLEKA